ncbi:MAG: membrane protein insertase YidC [Chloroflexota bacterium]
MDKRTTVGFVLVTVIILGWLMWTSTHQQQMPEKERKKAVAQKVESKQIEKAAVQPGAATSEVLAAKLGRFAAFAGGESQIITVETDLYVAKISSRGGSIMSWRLKKYNKWDGEPTQLIDNPYGELFLQFVTLEGKKIDTRELNFSVVDGAGNIKVTGKDRKSLALKLDLGAGKSIVRQYYFYGDEYAFDNKITLNNLEDILPTRGYDLRWNRGLRFQERNSVDEATEAVARVSQNGEVAELDAASSQRELSSTGLLDYAAMKTKYFTAALIPQPWQSFDGTVDVNGWREPRPDNGVIERYGISIRVPYRGGSDSKIFKAYIGPLDYRIVRSYGLERLVNFGFRIGIRQIGEYVMLPMFNFIHDIVPNYGISLILFAFFIKLLLHPLSIQQMRSSQKMQVLGPEMQRIREKYKDDQAKQQQETMKLYSEYGINPAGGCLPLLAQMPIFFALWATLRSAIDLRQSPFIWWINDLSVPDAIITFPGSFLGINHLSGLALLMGVTMYFQQKMTVTDPRQKSMVVMMPVLFVFMFSNFPAGLNLYYFMFNVLSIGQQVYMNKFSRNKPSLDDLKKSPKKEGWLQKKMREAQEMAAAQGRPMPGQKPQNREIKPGSSAKGGQGKKKK